MASHVRKVIPLLEYIQSLNRSARTKYLKGVGSAVIKAICNTIFNVNNGNISIPIETVNLLRPYKRQIKSICVLKRKSIEKRRKELIKADLFFKVMTHVIPQLLRYAAPKQRKEDNNDNDNDNDNDNKKNESE